MADEWMKQEESMEDFAAMFEASFHRVNNGDIVIGKILTVAEEWLMVDIGSYMDGVVSREELLYDGETMEPFVPGQELRLYVKRVDTREGQIYLSRKEADKVGVWDELEELRVSETPIELKVVRAVRGGLRVSYKQQAEGFIPASQIADRYVEDVSVWEGQVLTALVMEVRPEKKDFTATRRQLLQQQQKMNRDRVFASLKVGNRLTGTVTRLADFGAFVEISSGVEGLIHISDLSWSRVKHPSEILHEGDCVSVTVQAVDVEKGRISLRLKDIQADPWENLPFAVGEFKEGCRVNHIISTGAFVGLGQDLEGFLPISQISDKRLRSVEEVLQIGQEVTVQIQKIDVQQRRISVTMREVSQEPETEREDLSRYGNEKDLTTTLGSLFNNLDI